jgi:hypothetical protein
LTKLTGAAKRIRESEANVENKDAKKSGTTSKKKEAPPCWSFQDCAAIDCKHCHDRNHGHLQIGVKHPSLIPSHKPKIVVKDCEEVYNAPTPTGSWNKAKSKWVPVNKGKNKGVSKDESLPASAANQFTSAPKQGITHDSEPSWSEEKDEDELPYVERAYAKVKFNAHFCRADEVQVAGMFGRTVSTHYPMREYEENHWEVTIRLPAGLWRYHFVVDGHKRLFDPQIDENGIRRCVMAVRPEQCHYGPHSSSDSEFEEEAEEMKYPVPTPKPHVPLAPPFHPPPETPPLQSSDYLNVPEVNYAYLLREEVKTALEHKGCLQLTVPVYDFIINKLQTPDITQNEFVKELVKDQEWREEALRTALSHVDLAYVAPPLPPDAPITTGITAELEIEEMEIYKRWNIARTQGTLWYRFCSLFFDEDAIPTSTKPLITGVPIESDALVYRGIFSKGWWDNDYTGYSVIKFKSKYKHKIDAPTTLGFSDRRKVKISRAYFNKMLLHADMKTLVPLRKVLNSEGVEEFRFAERTMVRIKAVLQKCWRQETYEALLLSQDLMVNTLSAVLQRIVFDAFELANSAPPPLRSVDFQNVGQLEVVSSDGIPTGWAPSRV